MELDQAISLWRGRAADAALLGATSYVTKDGSRLVLLTSAEDVREISAPTRKCVNHWTFRAGSAHALHVPAARHPQSRVLFGVCGAPGVSASKKARQARRQEANKTTALPANEGLAVWRDTDLDVAKWRRAPLQSSAKAFALLVHSKLKEEVIVVFQDGSFATYDEDLVRGLHSDDAKDATAAEEEDDDDDDEQEESVVWAYLETDHRSPLKGALFLSILLQKTTEKGDKQLELMVYQITIPHTPRRLGGALGAVLLVRRRITLPDNEELSSCAFHAETFSYSIIGHSGSWQTLRFSRDALTNALTLVTSQQMPNLASSETDSTIPVHKKRKLKAAKTAASGYLVSGVGNYTYLVSTSLDSPLKFTGWDSKFAVSVSNTEINLATDKDGEAEVVVGRSTKEGVGKPVQLVSIGAGDAVLAAYERGAFLIHVRNKNSTLASVLGATASTGLTTSENSTAPAMPDSSVQWGSVTATSSVNNDTLDAETWKSNMCSDDDRERQLIADLSDPQVTPTAAEFTSRLDEALKKTKKKNKRKAGKEDGEELSHRLLQTVTRRCLDSTDLGLWGPLETMLRTDRLSARAEPTLLPTLMKHNQFALLECAIVHLIDIDERSIVRLLKYFIRKSSNSAFTAFVAKQVKSQNKKAAKVDGTAACERFAVALLGLPTNGVFLHRAIRELELEEVLLVLAICKKLLLVHTTGDDAEDEEETTKSPSKKSRNSRKSEDTSLAVMKTERRFAPLPSTSKSCAWICALLDAHLSALVQRASQNAEVSRTLHQLDGLVQLQLRASAQYESVHGVLSNFLSGVRLPRAPGLPDYSIEELRL
ncbi:hypothetical protein PHYPSEUDO_013947 [Phytophthora pseudosyringae]|uniref:Uncharacterized protein n=1 Tax=Phytophthora pseudosyringae TaxID=221518 RepID=A0A8T1W5X7_9STRA|nr:hypothetical protein PHYPSEUDO_013947 [Phytophthora pseudosyringae]